MTLPFLRFTRGAGAPAFAACLLALAALAAPAAAAGPTSGIDRAYMDTSIPPCRDFYRYANGAWLDTVKVPASYIGTGAGRELYDRNQEILHRTLERAAAGADREKDATIRKLGYLYRTLMDSTRADRDGLGPLAADFARVDAIRSRDGLMREFAWAAELGLRVPVGFQREVDPEASSRYVGQLWQGGLGLPERDYYFRTDAKSDTLRREYVAFVGAMLHRAGESEDAAGAHADAIMKLETALAESSLTRVQMRDPHALLHKMSVRELGTLAPEIGWPDYFRRVGVASLASPDSVLDVSMPAFARQLSDLVASTPLDTWKAYLKFHYLRVAAPWLDQRTYRINFDFQSKLFGLKESAPRWKRAAQAVDNAMGEALGKAYVAVAFPPSSKARMKELVANLRAALQERIESREWMSEATKKQALVKLAAMQEKIGYPDHWRDYSKLEISGDVPGVENLRRAQRFESLREIREIGGPVDRDEWGMSPPTVNAYYDPSVNEIVFPAGILQPPYFDPKADDAVNYGGIGMVIGHEMTHGFDDEGRQYDARGNLRDWWTKADAEKFDQRAQKVVEQYDGYVAVDSLHVNGKLTLGENIADLGGVTVAYHAWKRSLQGKPAPGTIDGFTPEQRFFLGFAQAWRSVLRPESERTFALTNPHSPPRWRVDGVVSNMPEFRQAFGCKAGDPMVNDPETRAAIW